MQDEEIPLVRVKHSMHLTCRGLSHMHQLFHVPEFLAVTTRTAIILWTCSSHSTETPPPVTVDIHGHISTHTCSFPKAAFRGIKKPTDHIRICGRLSCLEAVYRCLHLRTREEMSVNWHVRIFPFRLIHLIHTVLIFSVFYVYVIFYNFICIL